MSLVDIAVIIAYFVLLVFVGAKASKQVRTNKDALAGGPATVGNTTYGFESGL